LAVSLADASTVSSPFQLHSVRAAALQREANYLSVHSWASYGLFVALSAALRRSSRARSAAIRMSAPVREASAATGGVRSALAIAAGYATAPLQGHSIAIRKTAAASASHKVVALGADACAHRVILMLPAPDGTRRASAASPPSQRTWLVSAALGSVDPGAAGAGLVAWLNQAMVRRPGPSASRTTLIPAGADVLLWQRTSPVKTFILVGDGLATSAALAAWGAKPLGGGMMGRSGPDTLLSEARGGSSKHQRKGAAGAALAACAACMHMGEVSIALSHMGGEETRAASNDTADVKAEKADSEVKTSVSLRTTRNV